MLEKFSLKSVKAFDDRSTLHAAACTIITGKNSSGKSTLFQALLLIKQAFARSPRNFAGIHLNGPLVAIGTFEDWSTDRKSAPIELKVELCDSALADVPATWGWWQPAHRPRGTALVITASLELQLVPAPAETTSAHLERMTFRSEARLGSSAGTYSLQVHQRDASEKGLSPAESEGAAFEHRLVASLSVDGPDLHGERLSSQRLDLMGAGTCVVEGLAPTQIRVDTGEDAAPRTIAKAVTAVFQSFVDKLEATLGSAAPGGTVESGVTARFNSEASEAELLELTKFFSDSSPREFVSFCRASPEIAAQLILFGIAQGGGSWPIVAAAFYNRLLAAAFAGNVAVSDPDIARSCKVIVDGYPALEAPCAFLSQTWASSILGDQGKSELVALLAGAAGETLASTKWSRTAFSVADVLRPKGPDLGARHTGGEVPTEVGLRGFFDGFLFHLGPLRQEPRNLYSSDPPLHMADVGPRGERTIECLRRFGRDKVTVPLPGSEGLHPATLIDAVVRWARHLELTDALAIDRQSKYGTVFTVTTSATENAVQADLNNVGVGVSQALPVIVLCMAAPLGATILVEQPELHLHPAVQTKLADLVAACSKTGRQLLIETHSEHLVNGLRLLVADKRLSTKQLAVVYVSRDELGAEIRPITIGDDGSISHWPPGFFDESERVLLKLLERRTSK